MALPGTMMLAPQGAAAALGAPSRAAGGPSRAREGDDGATSFAGALAEAAGTRDDAAAGAEGTDPADRKPASEPGTDDAKPAPSAAAASEAAPPQVAPWLPWWGSPETRAADTAPTATDGTDGTAAALAGHALTGSAPDAAAPADARAIARDALAVAAAGEARPPKHSALPSSGDNAKVGTSDEVLAAAAVTQVSSPDRRSLPSSGDKAAPDPRSPAAAGPLPLPGDLDTTRIEARRTARGVTTRADKADAMTAATPRPLHGDIAGGPSRVLPPAPEAAALAPTRALQDATQADLRVGAVDARGSERSAIGGDALPAGLATAGAAASQGAQTAAKAGEAPLPFEARLFAALDSPEFVPSLGAQVSTLVRNGIPEARLHLHPAELGPITVQIEVDGQRAQVNMAVEHAATRQVLEQAIPTLASALRDNGLTLTGGGVFQQPREPQGQPGNGGGNGSDGERRGSRSGGGDAMPAIEAALPRARVQRGALDLYA